ncbi:MAG: hypothetical protein AB1810_06020 [Pseudomonadota bacterium]
MTENNKTNAENQEWVAYRAKEADQGFGPVLGEEKKYLRKKRGLAEDADVDELKALCLSGGGIRSAAFCSGVLQALAYRNWLRKFDYLSTVSGGGYIGTSVSWLLHRDWGDHNGKPIQFGTSRENFPYGTYPVWTRDRDEEALEEPPAPPLDRSEYQGRSRGAMLRWLRQHAKFLTPGRGINILSLAAVVLRGSFLSLFVYITLLVFLFMLLNAAGFFDKLRLPWDATSRIALPWIAAGALGALLAVGAFVYSFITHDARTPDGKNSRYHFRRFYEIWSGRTLLAILLLAALGALPLAHGKLQQYYIGLAGQTGAASTLLGLLASLWAFMKSGEKEPGKVPMGVVVALGSIFMLFGLLLLGYSWSIASLAVIKQSPALGLSCFALLALVTLIIAYHANLNYISIHRYYRDRLMETFLPDVHKAFDPDKYHSVTADLAEDFRLHDLYRQAAHNARPDALPPYHIINANIVTVESPIPKYRGRGGDNFMLSACYCGSNASGGWRATRTLMGGGMTLPTAMAISGAAVNPSAGCGGEGVTRQPFLSMLMGLLNIRLGYWAPNPNAQYLGRSTTPNFLWPGLWEVFLRRNLSERSWLIQLTDGGHFENLGIYEMIRRKARLIIVCDAGADPGYTFDDLANAIEKVRVDFGALIDIDNKKLQKLIPGKQLAHGELSDGLYYADQGFITANIDYGDKSHGKLIYIKATLIPSLTADMYGYKCQHPAFPHESTGDQFFDERQFEAYRELGYQIAWTMMERLGDDTLD